MIYDISLPLDESVAVWDGDTEYRFDLVSRIADGATVNVGALSLSTHTGTHLDAPFHFDPTGATIDTLSLQPFLGRARVVDVTGQRQITPESFSAFDLRDTPRVLLKTGIWSDFSQFPLAVPDILPETVALLAAKNVLLLGVDFPSVDALDSKKLPIHHALYAGSIAILESVDLRSVPAGVYELIALPLRLVGADASPVRAVLRTIESEVV